MEQEIDEEELLARVRRNLLLNGKSARSAPDEIDVQAQIIAERWMGRDNAQRLQQHRPEGKRFRPAAVVVVYEFYWFTTPDTEMPEWRINRVENGRQEDYRSGSSTTELQTELAAIRKKGGRIREVVLGFQGDKRNSPPSSQRKAIINSLKDFRP